MVLRGFKEKYEELRNAYNSVIDNDDRCAKHVPPMEEWRGMTGICDHIFCRWAIGFAGRVAALSAV